jgi:anti-sigma factor RsiW
MTCDQNPATLAAWLDAELSEPEQIAVQQHLLHCPGCASEIAALVHMRRQLSCARSRFVPSPEFRKKIQLQIAARSRRRSLIAFMPVTAAVIFIVALSFAWTREAARTASFREVIDLHLNDLVSASPVDVISTDRHTVKPWFQGRVPFAFNLPEFAGTEFTLVGGRVVYLHQQPCAQLIVALGQHKISVLIAQESLDWTHTLPRSTGVDRSNTFNLETWRGANLRFFVVGDADPREIGRLADAFRSANRS